MNAELEKSCFELGVAEVGGCEYRVAKGPSDLPSDLPPGKGVCAKLGQAELSQ